jgi:hypothetical protein
LDLANPPSDDGRVRAGLERLSIAGEPGVTVRERPPGSLTSSFGWRRRFMGLRERPTGLVQAVGLKEA